MDRDKGTKVTIKVAIIHLNHNLNQQSIQRCMDQRRSCGPMDRASDYGSGDCRFESGSNFSAHGTIVVIFYKYKDQNHLKRKLDLKLYCFTEC